MKILQINKFLYPKGGAETYFLELSKLLEQNGHEVIYFSQKNSKNITLKNEELFISDLDLSKFSFTSLFKLGRIFWSFKAARKISKLIKKEKPDIVHIHNIYHQISPSILKAIKKFNLPIVMTVHDFKLIIHDYTLRADGKKKTPKNSHIVDRLLKTEFAFHKFTKVYQKNIDLFITPSQFVRKKLIENGFDSKKIITVLHFTKAENVGAKKRKHQNYILSFGRLDESKGIDTLLKAFSRIADKKVKLKIAGTGDQEATLKALAQELEIDDRVEFLGHKTKAEVAEAISNCLFTVFPSRMHETFGLVISESFVLGKTVVASKVGAIPELVKNNKTGLLFNVDSAKGLATAIDSLLADRAKLKLLSKNAKAEAKKYDSGKHYKKIISLYNKLIAQSKATAGKQIDKKEKRAKTKEDHYLLFQFIFTSGTIAVILFCVVQLMLVLTTPSPRVLPKFTEKEYQYPRLANLYWKTPITKEDATALAKWDLLILDMSAQNQSEEAIKYLRQLNPHIIILAYTSFTESPKLSLREPGDKGVWHDLASGIKPAWKFKTYDGQNVSWWPENTSQNPCAKDANGKYYMDYMANFLDKKLISSGLWDGIFFDTTWQEVAWVNNKIDIDSDGKADDINKINKLWHQCHQDFFNKLRARLGSQYIIMGNGDGVYDNVNGRLFEGFPEFWEGEWAGSMKRYQISNNATSTVPRINIINSDTNNTGNNKDYQTMRYGLGSALLFNGFYSFDYGTQLREQFWTYDEYTQNLGQPVASALNVLPKSNKEIKDGVWRRNFENGIVIVNATDKDQNVKLEKNYKKILGTQDTSVNNGETVNKVSLKSRDAIILLTIK